MKRTVWLCVVAGLVVASAFGQRLMNDLRGSYTAPATTATAIAGPTNGLTITIITICNTGAFRCAVWGGNLTNILFSSGAMVTNVDASVTNINVGGIVLAATNGVMAIALDGVSDNQRTWYAQGLGGTAVGTINRTPRLP